MNLEEFEKFNHQCGIAKVCDIESHEWFVVYADTMEKDNLEDHHLGEVVGKGKTKEDAMKHAITILLNKIMKIQKNMEEFEEKITQMFHNRILEEEIILPVEEFDVIYDEKKDIHAYVDNGKFHNADVVLSDGKAFLGSI